MKQMDDNIGYVLKKLEDMGQLDNTIVVFTTDNGAETITFPDGGITPFKGGKLSTWEGGMRAPMVIRWPGVIKPGTVKNDIFASLDWLPTLVDIARRRKGRRAEEADRGRPISRHRQDHARWRQPARLPRRQVGKVGARYFFYYSGSDPSAVRYKNWKMYFTMAPGRPGGLYCRCPLPLHWAQVVNIKRDPFETSVGSTRKTLWAWAARSAPRSTAYLYDWNMLPIGQELWLKELESYEEFPPLQDPASYNLDQVMQQIKQAKTAGRSD